MIFSSFFESHDNHYQACFSDVDGLRISSRNIFLDNIFDHHPVKANGVEIGYYNVIEVNENILPKLEIVIPKKFKIPEDSVLQVNRYEIPNSYNANHINVILGQSTALLQDKAAFLGSECQILTKPEPEELGGSSIKKI
jgi:hypothetical protein